MSNYNLSPASDEQTYQFKKSYDDFLVFGLLPKNVFVLNPKTTETIICFVKCFGEQFGESIPYSLKEGEKIEIICYENGNVFLKKQMTLVDSRLGEFKYTFNNFDLVKNGIFECEINLLEKTIAKFKINVKGNANVFSSVSLVNQPIIIPSTSNVYLSSIEGIISDVRYISFNLVENSQVLGHFEISEIVSLNINASSVLIYTNNNSFTKITFPNFLTASLAFDRISLISNGAFFQ